MEEGSRERTEERRRRTGPLGEEGAGETTRRVPVEGDREGAGRREAATTSTRGRGGDKEDPGTRVIRTPGASGTREEEALQYPRGYMEAAEAREERLREVYGGVDWLASFIGCVFAVVCAAAALLLLSGLVLAPLGFALDLEQIDTMQIIGLSVIGFVLLASFFCGGYVAGRLARFDGGRNGAATVLWGLLLSFVFLVAGSLLPGELFGMAREFVWTSIAPAIENLSTAGLVGAGILAGALLLEFLGGFLGGRLGNSYHARIDETA